MLVTPFLNNRRTLCWLSHHSKKERITGSFWYHNIFTLVYSAIFILQATLIWQILLHLSNTKSSHQTFEKSTSLNHNFHLAEIKMVEFDRGLKGTPKSEFLHNVIFYMTICILFVTFFIILISLDITRNALKYRQHLIRFPLFYMLLGSPKQSHPITVLWIAEREKTN